MSLKFPYLPYFVVIALMAGGLYFNTWENEFTGFDDVLLITEQWNNIPNTSYIKSAFTKNVFQSPSGDYYRPLQLLSYKLDWHLWGSSAPSPFPFLLGNICWLAISLCATFYTLSRWFLSHSKAFFAISVLLLLPATIQSVCWIPGRGELILLTWVMLYVHLLLSYLQTPTFSFKMGVLISFSFALFTKETAIIIPILSFFYLYLMAKHQQKTFFKLVPAFVVIACIWFICRFWALGNVAQIDLINQLIKLPFRLILTIGQLVLPYPLAVFKGWDPLQFTIVLFVIGIAALLVFKYAKNNPLIYFGFVWLVLFCMPSGLNSLIMFHRGYVASIGMIFIFSSLSTIPQNAVKWSLIIASFLLLTVPHYLFRASFNNAPAFWNNAYRHNPNSSMAINGLAWTYQHKGDVDKAIPLFQESIALNPLYPQNRINLAYAYASNHRFDSLDYLMAQEFAITKDSSLAAYHFGGLLLLKGDTSKAIPYLKMGKKTVTYNFHSSQYYDTLSIELD